MRNTPLKAFIKKEEKPDPAILTGKEKTKLTKKFHDRDFTREKFNIAKFKRKNIPHDWNSREV